MIMMSQINFHLYLKKKRRPSHLSPCEVCRDQNKNENEKRTREKDQTTCNLNMYFKFDFTQILYISFDFHSTVIINLL